MGEMGIGAGDAVRIESRSGLTEVRVRADRDVPDGIVFIPFFFTEAAANILTNPQLDPVGKIPEFKFCVARITMIEELAAAEYGGDRQGTTPRCQSSASDDHTAR